MGADSLSIEWEDYGASGRIDASGSITGCIAAALAVTIVTVAVSVAVRTYRDSKKIEENSL